MSILAWPIKKKMRHHLLTFVKMASSRLLIGAIRGSQIVSFHGPKQVARLASWNSRLYCSTSSTTSSTTISQDQAKKTELAQHPVLDLPSEDDGFKEHFIPISRRSLVAQLMQKEDFLSSAECKRFEEFALALDSAIDNQFHGVLAELKSLFDPLNPDKDTVVMSKKLRQREILDNEFWLLQKLSSIMEKANFRELPQDVVKKALDDHLSGEGVRVSVNPNSYDILRFWALGKHLPETTTPWYQAIPTRLFYRATKQPQPPPLQYYRRVVVAVRSKGYKKLLLKMFKEIPTGALEHLLPDGKIQMSKFDQSFLGVTVAVGSLTILVKGVTFLADINVQWTLIVASITGILGLRGWNSYKNRRTKYMSELSRTLYFKNIANNRGLLTLLVDRAQDESFKEALLTYAFLLTQRQSSHVAQLESDDVTLPATLGGISSSLLEKQVQKWVHQMTGASMEFDCAEAVKLLTSFGILRVDSDNTLSVVNLDAAINAIPPTWVSIATRAEEETELDDPYDRVFFEKEEQYKKEEKKRRKTGWT